MSVIEMQSSKFEIIELLLRTNNKELIHAIKEALSQDTTVEDFYDELSEIEKARIELSKEDIAKGNVLSHEEVMQEFRQKYQR
jgi:predicted transcriptional regulator